MEGCKAGIRRSVSALDVSPRRKVESAVTTETMRLAYIAASTRNAMAEMTKTAKHHRKAMREADRNRRETNARVIDSTPV